MVINTNIELIIREIRANISLNIFIIALEARLHSELFTSSLMDYIFVYLHSTSNQILLSII